MEYLRSPTEIYVGGAKPGLRVESNWDSQSGSDVWLELPGLAAVKLSRPSSTEIPEGPRERTSEPLVSEMHKNPMAAFRKGRRRALCTVCLTRGGQRRYSQRGFRQELRHRCWSTVIQFTHRPHRMANGCLFLHQNIRVAGRTPYLGVREPVTK